LAASFVLDLLNTLLKPRFATLTIPRLALCGPLRFLPRPWGPRQHDPGPIARADRPCRAAWGANRRAADHGAAGLGTAA